MMAIKIEKKNVIKLSLLYSTFELLIFINVHIS